MNIATVENFVDKIELLCLHPAQKKSSGDFKFTSIPLGFGDRKVLIKLRGRLKVFQHKNENYSLGISVDDDNREMLESFEKKIQSLKSKQLIPLI